MNPGHPSHHKVLSSELGSKKTAGGPGKAMCFPRSNGQNHPFPRVLVFSSMKGLCEWQEDLNSKAMFESSQSLGWLWGWFACWGIALGQLALLSQGFRAMVL